MSVQSFVPIYRLALGQREKSQIDFKSLLILAFLMLGVIALSAAVFSSQSLRLDESQSIWQSSHSPLGVINTISRDVHVPLYGLVLHFWQLLFGTGVESGRMLSLIFFLLSIPAIFVLGKTAYNKQIGLFAAVLLAISPFLNWYGNEMRMYSLLLFLTILNNIFFVKIYLGGKERRVQVKQRLALSWWGYAAVSFLGIYTHYFFWVLLLTQGIFFLFNRKTFPKNSLRNFIIIALFLLAAIAPWLYWVQINSGVASQTPSLSRPSSSDFFNVFSQFFFGFQDDHINTIIISLWPISVLLAFLALREKKQFRLPSIFFIVTAILPILVALAVSIWVRPVFLARYLILSVPALYIFIAWLLSTYPPKVANVLKVALCLLIAFTFYEQVASAGTPVKENYRQAAEFLQAHAGPSDVIILSAPFTIYPVQYYYKGPTAITTLPVWNPYQIGSIPPFLKDRLPLEVDRLVKNHENVWLLLSYNQGYQEEIFMYFETHFQRLRHKNFSPKLDLYEYKINYEND